MNVYSVDETIVCSWYRLPFGRLLTALPEGEARICAAVSHDPKACRTGFALTDERQLRAPEGLWLLNETLYGAPWAMDEGFRAYAKKGRVRAVNARHPRAFAPPISFEKKGGYSIHIVALGDVGGTLLLALRLLGEGVIERIGIFDPDENRVRRYEIECGQMAWPLDYDGMPRVHPVSEEDLFDCDVFAFCATKGTPPVGGERGDVRLVQLEGNRAILTAYARMARERSFEGTFAVVSDPVDLLCRHAFEESNRDEAGNLDLKGLLPEQIRGFGLGVMNARAAYFAKRDPRFAMFLTEGRVFGPHGQDLVIANSIEAYDNVLSKELTGLVTKANLDVRALGFKPYLAPAVSSAALSLLRLLRGQFHYSAVFLGGVFMGCLNRQTPRGIETEVRRLPEALYARLERTYEALGGWNRW